MATGDGKRLFVYTYTANRATLLDMSRVLSPLATLALLATVLLAAPAHADDPADFSNPTPVVAYPLARVGNTVDVEVMIQAPLKSWGIRQAAKFYDAQVDGLTIHTRGTCASQPQAVCVQVVIRSFSDAEMLAITYGATPEWHGATQLGATPSDPRTIFLNLRFGQKRGVASHELGHVLGLDHHTGEDGAMGVRMQRVPSTAELDALRAFYSTPAQA